MESREEMVGVDMPLCEPLLNRFSGGASIGASASRSRSRLGEVDRRSGSRTGPGVEDEGQRMRGRLSSKGRPQPHFLHFLSMCCSQIFRQSTSSSARACHRRETWEARAKDMASRWLRTFMAISEGRTTKGSTRMILRSSWVRKESWEKQHMVSTPRRMSSRLRWDAEEKLDQMLLTASRSASGRASRLWKESRGEQEVRRRHGRNTGNRMELKGNNIPAASYWWSLRQPSAGGEHRAFAEME